MKLSMSMIANYLKDYRLEYHIPADTLSIQGVRFFSDQELSYSLEYVYIGPAEKYFQDPRMASTLILANGQNHILCRSADSEELLNSVLSAFDYYNKIEHRLYAASVRHHPLEELLSIIEEVLPGAFLVFSLEGTLLAHIRLDNLPDKDLLDSILRTRNIRSSVLGSTLVDKDNIISHDLTDRPLHLHRKGSDNHGAVSMYLMQDQDAVGFIMYFPVSELDISLALSLESFFARHITESEAFTAPDSIHQSMHAILIQLLKGTEILPGLRDKIRKQIKADSGDVIRLFVFQTLAIRNYTLRSILGSEIEQSSIPCISCEYEGQGVVLVCEKHLHSLLRLIMGEIPAGNISFGVSMPLLDIQDLRSAFGQASFALQNGKNPGVHYCQDYALDRFIDVLQNDELSCRLLHPAIPLLQSYDQKHGTDLYTTLCRYLHTGCSQAAAAHELHIHLNTLKYRIRRICEIADIHFDDWEELLYLQVSVQIDEKKAP